MSITTKLSSKGQIVIPKSVRDARGWKAGTEFTVHETAQGLTITPKRLFRETTLDEVAGFLKNDYKGPRRTIKEMRTAAEGEAVKRYLRAIGKL